MNKYVAIFWKTPSFLYLFRSGQQRAQAPCHRDGMMLAASCFCTRFCGVRLRSGTLEHFASARPHAVRGCPVASRRARPASGSRPAGEAAGSTYALALACVHEINRAERRYLCLLAPAGPSRAVEPSHLLLHHHDSIVMPVSKPHVSSKFEIQMSSIFFMVMSSKITFYNFEKRPSYLF